MSRKRPGPHSCHCRAGEGSGKGGRVQTVSLEMQSVKEELITEREAVTQIQH